MSSGDSFIDEATLNAYAGNGGDGFVGFRREKFVPLGGPDGGDGGRGGDVVMVATRNLATLRDQRMRREVRAEDGGPGEGNNRTGRGGDDAEVAVPVGTVVIDREAPEGSEPLADLTEDGQRARVARGGRGGRGNARFKTATRQTPDFAERGQPGQIRKLRLSLKLLADVGLVGFPNAGKSTLLRRLSAARPKVGDYPFTTLTPCLGVAEVGERRFVVADIPGLIEGASEGAGLGDRFLRHIERTRVLVHLLDAGALVMEERDLVAGYDQIRRELGAYDAALLERPEIVAVSKVDVLPDREAIAPLTRTFESRGVSLRAFSSATGEGVEELLFAMARALDADEAARGAA